MAIRAISLANMSKYESSKMSDRWNPGKYVVDLSKLKKYKNDTFIAIFSPGSANLLTQFEAAKDEYKLLFKNEKKAINTIHWGDPRNTVVVFELK